MNSAEFVKRVIESIQKKPIQWLNTEKSSIVFGKDASEIEVFVDTWTNGSRYDRPQFKACICVGKSLETSMVVYGWEAEAIYFAVKRVAPEIVPKSVGQLLDRMAALLP